MTIVDPDAPAGNVELKELERVSWYHLHDSKPELDERLGFDSTRRFWRVENRRTGVVRYYTAPIEPGRSFDALTSDRRASWTRVNIVDANGHVRC